MKNKTLDVLEALKQNFGRFISGEKIAKLLKISRVAVYKIINKLNSEGYKILKNKKLGYKLLAVPFSPEEILKQNFKLVNQLYYYKETTSTMDIAKQILAKTSKIDKILIVAEKQSSGKGRIERVWFSPEGGLYFSLIVKPQILPTKIFIFNYMFSLAVAKVLKEKYSINATTKWPNDVLVKNKKICGILIETDTEIDKVNWCVVGVGVNVNIKKEFFLKNKLEATSILIETKKTVNLTEFLIYLFKEIEKWYSIFEKGQYDIIINEWCKISSTIGKEVEIITLNDKIKGIAKKVSPQTGALLLKTNHGLKEIFCGDCIHLR